MRSFIVGLAALAVALVAPGCGKSDSGKGGTAPTKSEAKPDTPDKKGEGAEKASKEGEGLPDDTPKPPAKPLPEPVKLDAPPKLPAGAERWQAVIDLGMQKLELLIDFVKDDKGVWSATLGLPDKGIYRIGLTEVSYVAETINFTLYKPAAPKASEVYALEPDGKGSAKGTMSIGDQKFTVTAKKLKADAKVESAIKRPQTPKTPYPYETREMMFTNAKDGVKRSGLLSIPKGKGPHPVVIIESGSGPHDRDGTFAQHKGYLVIGDFLTRKGIATLRTDDRGVGKSTGVDADANHQTLTDDVLAMVAALKKVPEIDPKKIGVMGHSQGGSVAPMAAAQSADVAFVVMLAGIGVPGDQVMMDQKRLILESMGKTAEQLEPIMAHQRKMLDAILEDSDAATIRKLVTDSLQVELTKEQLAQVTPELKKNIIDAGAKSLQAGFMRALVKAKPATYLSKVKVPVLAIWGMKDLQVEPKSNSAGFKKAMEAAGNKDAEVWLVPRMSHNLQETDTGKLEELASIEETVRPVLLNKLAAWIGTKTGLIAKAAPAPATK